MIHINLRDFYPEYYKNDYFVEVPKELAEQFKNGIGKRKQGGL